MADSACSVCHNSLVLFETSLGALRVTRLPFVGLLSFYIHLFEKEGLQWASPTRSNFSRGGPYFQPAKILVQGTEISRTKILVTVPRTSHRPVFDRFQYVESRSDQKLTVGRPGNEANMQGIHCKSSSPLMLSWFLSPHAEFYSYLKRSLWIGLQTT